MDESATNPYQPPDLSAEHSKPEPSEDIIPRRFAIPNALFTMFRAACAAFVTFIWLCSMSGVGIQWDGALLLFIAMFLGCLLSHGMETRFGGDRKRVSRQLLGYPLGVVLTLCLYLVGLVVSISNGMPANFLKGM
ncbi:MAG: hypothetical protein AAFX06_16950 [Planctomycetota bacterium]